MLSSKFFLHALESLMMANSTPPVCINDRLLKALINCISGKCYFCDSGAEIVVTRRINSARFAVDIIFKCWLKLQVEVVLW